MPKIRKQKEQIIGQLILTGSSAGCLAVLTPRPCHSLSQRLYLCLSHCSWSLGDRPGSITTLPSIHIHLHLVVSYFLGFCPFSRPSAQHLPGFYYIDIYFSIFFNSFLPLSLSACFFTAKMPQKKSKNRRFDSSHCVHLSAFLFILMSGSATSSYLCQKILWEKKCF